MIVTLSVTAKRTLRYGLSGALLLSCSPAALHAEISNAQLAREIAELKAQIRSLKGSVVETRKESHGTREKVRVITERGTGYALPPPGPALPLGATPVFVTADKKMQFGSLTITPGGFVAAEGVFRSRTEQADIGSQYQAIPFGPQAGTNEFRFSARQSRIALLTEAPITPTFLAAAYGEFDFLGSGVTSNSNESNSFVPRIRHLYGQLDATDVGIHFLAGQTWSLATMNSKGITPRNEVTPPSIDSQYVPGFVWKRQPQVRLTKDFNQKLWLSISAEQPQNTFTGCNAGVDGTSVTNNIGAANPVTCDLNGNNNLNGTVATNNLVAGGQSITNFSLNHIPDVIGKAAYEANIADRDVHLEAFGIYRDLYDRVAYPVGGITQTASNQNTTGYGVGGGLIVPIIPKRLDFQASGLWGRGIGSYGTAQFTDSTFNANGSPSPIRESMALAGLTLHATPAIDLYVFAGLEQVQPDFYTTNAAGTAFGGYGAPNGNNSGCFDTLSLGSCSGAAKRVFQVTGGMWDKIYKGSFGEVRVGLQYSYTQRELFQGYGAGAAGAAGTVNAGTPALAALPYSPHQNDQLVLTSFRYYPFQ